MIEALQSLLDWSLQNPITVFVASLILAVVLGTDEKTIPITQNLNLAVFILAGGSIFLFYAQGGFQSIAMNIASGVIGGVVVATVLAISKD